MEKISVIIPVYKVEGYLDACLESVAGQTYGCLEIILVDDGSPDGCPQMCDEWARRDNRVRVIHQKNKGLSGARNAGLDAMTGEYVTFVDSDDMIHPEMLMRLYAALGGGDMAVCSFERFPDGKFGGFDSLCDCERKEFPSKKALAEGALLSRTEAWGKLYRAELFDGLRFKEGILYEDTHIFPYLMNKAEKLTVLSEKMYFYRQLDTSIMRSGISERKFCVFDVYAEHLRLYRRLKMPIAAGYVCQALVAKTVKASVICGKGLRGRFYRVFFKNLPRVIFAPAGILSFKNRLLYLSAALPVKPFRSYYERRLSESLNLKDTSNF